MAAKAPGFDFNNPPIFPPLPPIDFSKIPKPQGPVPPPPKFEGGTLQKLQEAIKNTPSLASAKQQTAPAKQKKAAQPHAYGKAPLEIVAVDLINDADRVKNIINSKRAIYRSNPTPYNAFELVWALFYTEQNTPELMEILEEVFQTGFRQAAFYHVRANVYFLQENYDNALVDLETCVELDPNNAEAWQDIGLVLENEDEEYFESRKLLYRNRIAASPDDSYAKIYLGFLILNETYADGSESPLPLFQEVLKSPHARFHLIARFGIAKELKRVGRDEDARQEYLSLLADAKKVEKPSDKFKSHIVPMCMSALIADYSAEVDTYGTDVVPPELVERYLQLADECLERHPSYDVYSRKCSVLFNSGRFDEAIACAHAATSFLRWNSECWYYMACAHYAKKEHQAALESLKFCISFIDHIEDSKSQLFKAYQLLGNIYFALKQYEYAIWSFEISDKYSKAPRNNLMVGKCLYKLRNLVGALNAAIDKFQKEIALDDKNLEAQKYLLKCNLRQDDMYAEVYLRKFLELVNNPGLPFKYTNEAMKRYKIDVHFYFGRHHFNAGKLDESLKHYEIVLRNDPNHCDALRDSAYCLEVQGKKEQAKVLIERLVQRHPKDARTWLFSAGFHIGMKNYKIAAMHLAEAEKYNLNGFNGKFFMEKGRLAYMEGKYAEAIDFSKKALEKCPRYTASIYELMGSSHLALGQYSEAVRCCTLSLQNDVQPRPYSYSPDSLRLDRADANMALEKWSEAKKDLELVKKSSPKNPEVLLKLAKCYAHTGNDPLEAIVAYNEYLKVPDSWDWETISGLVVLYLKREMVSLAITKLEQFLEKFPDHPEATAKLKELNALQEESKKTKSKEMDKQIAKGRAKAAASTPPKPVAAQTVPAPKIKVKAKEDKPLSENAKTAITRALELIVEFKKLIEVQKNEADISFIRKFGELHAQWAMVLDIILMKEKIPLAESIESRLMNSFPYHIPDLKKIFADAELRIGLQRLLK